MKSMNLGILLLFLFSLTSLTLISFAVSGGGGGGSGGSNSGGGGPPSPPKPAAEIFLTGSCSGQPVAISVSGDGAPVSGASVEITILSQGRSPVVVASGTTDSSGVFTFTPNTPASYDAVVSGSSIQSAGKVFSVSDCSKISDTKTRDSDGSTNNSNNSVNGTPGGTRFQCADFQTMRERIACRISISEEEAKTNLLFLPEECRTLNGSAYGQCIATYSVIQRCRHLSLDKDRDRCFFTQMYDLTNLSSLRSACGDNSTCVDDLRAKVFTYVKFRIYNLEEKSEELWEKGILTKDETVSFIEKMEIKKQKFNNATSVDDKKAVIKEIQKDWQSLKGTILIRVLGE